MPAGADGAVAATVCAPVSGIADSARPRDHSDAAADEPRYVRECEPRQPPTPSREDGGGRGLAPRAEDEVVEIDSEAHDARRLVVVRELGDRLEARCVQMSTYLRTPEAVLGEAELHARLAPPPGDPGHEPIDDQAPEEVVEWNRQD